MTKAILLSGNRNFSGVIVKDNKFYLPNSSFSSTSLFNKELGSEVEPVVYRFNELIDSGGRETSYDDVYGAGWNGNLEPPTKNAVYDKIETIIAGVYTDEQAQDAIGAIIADTATIDATYTDATPELKFEVKDNSISHAKLQDISATNRILGRITTGAGDTEELTAANVRTIINVANGSTANSSDATLLARANHTGTQLLAPSPTSAPLRMPVWLRR
jgi:hypothetical protein